MKYLNISDFLQQSLHIWFELIVENALTLHITVTCQSLSGSLLAFSCILFNESAENKFVRGMVTKFIAVRGAQQDIIKLQWPRCCERTSLVRIAGN